MGIKEGVSKQVADEMIYRIEQVEHQAKPTQILNQATDALKSRNDTLREIALFCASSEHSVKTNRKLRRLLRDRDVIKKINKTISHSQDKWEDVADEILQSKNELFSIIQDRGRESTEDKISKLFPGVSFVVTDQQVLGLPP